jgi:hypothetical protein
LGIDITSLHDKIGTFWQYHDATFGENGRVMLLCWMSYTRPAQEKGPLKRASAILDYDQAGSRRR